MLIIDAVRRAIRGVAPEPDNGVSPWLMLFAAVVFFVAIVGAALLIKALWAS